MRIVFENDSFVVIEKPADLLVHPTMRGEKDTLTAWLLKKYPVIKDVGDDPVRPGIVHRLDKDASGLLAVAKTQKAFDHLKKQFQDRKIKKEYLVLVYGKMEKEKGVIDVPIGWKKGRGKMSARRIPQTGDKEAITEYEVIRQFSQIAFLRVKIKTGRTHQIRAHMKSIGHPVVGDPLYKPKHTKKADLERIFLHATKLGFHDLQNKWQEFEIELPDELKNFLSTLK